MKNRLFAVGVALMLVLFGTGSAARVTQGQGIKTIPVKFKPGTTATTVTGSIKGDGTYDYKFGASGGQSLKIKLISKSTSLYFNLLPAENQKTGEALDVEPRTIEQTEWQGKLPKDGEYIVRVYLNRNAARRGASANYSLQIEIK